MIFLVILIIMFAPTVCVVVIATILALCGVKPPKRRSNLSWFQKNDW